MMDQNRIYIKTSLGESTIQQRRRDIQRNVRMILILVDGHSSVADLTLKTGNLQLTENALIELEKGGYIELAADVTDLPQSENDLSPDEIKPAARNEVLQSLAAAEERKDDQALAHERAASRAPDGPVSVVSKSAVAHYSQPVATHDLELDLSRFSLPPDFGGSRYPSSEKSTGRSSDKPILSQTKPNVRQQQPFLEQLKAMWGGAGHILKDAQIEPESVRRQGKGRMKRWVWTATGLVVTLLVLSVMLLLTSLDRFVPRLEMEVSSVVGRPVSIQSLQVKFLPTPALVLDRVRLGQDREAISAEAIRLYPDLTLLLSERRDLRKVVVSGINLELRQVAAISDIVESLSRASTKQEIEYLYLEKFDLSFGEIVIKNAEAEINRNGQGALQALSVRSADKSLTLLIEPNGSTVNLNIEAFAWSSEAGSKPMIDSLTGKGRLEQGALRLSELSLRMLGGVVNGAGAIRVNEKGNDFSGDFTFERIDAIRLEEALGIKKAMTGTMAGKMQLTATIDPSSFALSSVSGSGDFNVVRGALYGIDLAEAARRLSVRPVQGGVTSFEQMSARIRTGAGKTRIYDVSMSSGLMQSTGFFDLAKGGQMSGRLELRMGGSANQTRLPILISGTLDAPLVQVSDSP